LFRQAASGGKYYDIMVMDYVWLKLMVVVVRGGGGGRYGMGMVDGDLWRRRRQTSQTDMTSCLKRAKILLMDRSLKI